MHIPSLACTFFILYNFQWKRLLDQIFGILLIVNTLIILIELPFTLAYVREGIVLTTRICPGWIIVNYTLFILSIILTAWTSIERYLFIFHDQFIKRYRFYLHYFPIGFFIVYTPIFYSGLVIFYPCQSVYDPQSYICDGPCYLLHTIPCLIDWCLNVVFVLSITCIINITLIYSNIRQKQRMKRLIITVQNTQQWRRTIKLSIQLFSISSLCIIGWIPYGIVSTMQLIVNTEFLNYLLSTFFIYFPYAQTLFAPYACLFFMPEIKNKLFNILTSMKLHKQIHPLNNIHTMTLHGHEKTLL